MSQLTSAKAAAAADLASAKASIANYVASLEASVNANKLLVIGVGVAGLIVGAVVGHLI